MPLIRVSMPLLSLCPKEPQDLTLMATTSLLTVDYRSVGSNKRDFMDFLTGATTSTKCFRGHITTHFKGFFVGSNEFFTKFHFISWFMRYH
jgi:hypothetical protein